jgi:hypothetical protein
LIAKSQQKSKKWVKIEDIIGKNTYFTKQYSLVNDLKRRVGIDKKNPESLLSRGIHKNALLS